MSEKASGGEFAPRVSVVLAVYNGERFVGEAVASILAQTFSELELIVVDDGSTDGTRHVLEGVGDPRLRVEHLESNAGLARALNVGLERASGELIARQDADDVSLPERLAAQVALFDTLPDLVVCGTSCEFVDESGRLLGHKRPPATDTAIRWAALFESPFLHPSVMLRAQALRSNGLRYEPDAVAAIDYELWSRLLPHGRAANIERPLIRYRRHAAQMTATAHEAQRLTLDAVARSNLRALGLDLELDEVARLRGLYSDPPLSFGPEELRLSSLLFAALSALRRQPGVDQREARRIARGLIDSTLVRGRRGGLRNLFGSGLPQRLLAEDPLWVAGSGPRWVGRHVARGAARRS